MTAAALPCSAGRARSPSSASRRRSSSRRSSSRPSRRCTGTSAASSGSTTSRRSCSSSRSSRASGSARRRSRARAPSCSRFFAAFALVYLAGFWDITTKQGLTQFWKGMTKFAIHWSFMVAAIALSRAARRGVLLARARVVHARLRRELRLRDPPARRGARRGHNLDNLVLSPLTGGASSIDIFGHIAGSSIYRVNALTVDPNHLGVMLDRAAARADARLPADGARAIASSGGSRGRSRSCSSSRSRRSRGAAGSGSASAR